jgi:hypothetical protein
MHQQHQEFFLIIDEYNWRRGSEYGDGRNSSRNHNNYRRQNDQQHFAIRRADISRTGCVEVRNYNLSPVS